MVFSDNLAGNILGNLNRIVIFTFQTILNVMVFGMDIQKKTHEHLLERKLTRDGMSAIVEQFAMNTNLLTGKSL